MERRFDAWATAKLRERYTPKVCVSLECIECGAFFQPGPDTAQGLCEFCVEALATA